MLTHYLVQDCQSAKYKAVKKQCLGRILQWKWHSVALQERALKGSELTRSKIAINLFQLCEIQQPCYFQQRFFWHKKLEEEEAYWLSLQSMQEAELSLQSMQDSRLTEGHFFLGLCQVGFVAAPAPLFTHYLFRICKCST